MDDFEFENPGDLPPEEAAKLEAQIEAIDEASRKIGLYVEGAAATYVPGPFGQRKAIFVHYTIGDIAFAPRTQDPEQDNIDKQFQDLITNTTNDEFLSEREKMKRNIQAGRDPLDDGDDNGR